MEIWQPGREAICLVVAFAYGLQALQICLLPVPSSFSTFSLITGRLRGEGDEGGLPVVASGAARRLRHRLDADRPHPAGRLPGAGIRCVLPAAHHR